MRPAEALDRIRFLDEAACKDTALSRRSPGVLLALTLLFILCVVSFPKYTLSGLVPLALYPLYALSAAEIPGPVVRLWLKAGYPLLLGLGILNPLLDPARVALPFQLSVSAGWLSLFSLLLKGTLTLTAGLALIGATGLPRLTGTLRRLGVPEPITLQLLLMGRYLSLLLEEGTRITSAWQLRSAGRKGLTPEVWGPLMGQWLLRSLDRSHRIYQAMKLRGFDGDFHEAAPAPVSGRDWRFLAFWASYFIINRLFNLSQLLGMLLTGGLL